MDELTKKEKDFEDESRILQKKKTLAEAYKKGSVAQPAAPPKDMSSNKGLVYSLLAAVLVS